MFARSSIWVFTTILAFGWSSQTLRSAGSGSNANPPSSHVEVVAFEEARGVLLFAPEVHRFESENGRDLSKRFHDGIAEGIPYGFYRIEAWITDLSPELRYVWVHQPRTTIVLGMPVSDIESTPFPDVQGRIVEGAVPKRSFVKLAGIYSGQQMESAIEADGTFGFGAVRYGRYLLLIIGDGGFFASKDVTITPATLVGSITVSFADPPLQIEMRRGRNEATLKK